MKKPIVTYLLSLTLTVNLLISTVASACDCMTEHNVDQKNKAFSFSSITIAVGDRIKFTNSDSYFHNVYSLSDVAQFDLGSYPKGESRTITFDKVGKILAQCAIHPKMKLDITVEEKKVEDK